MNERFKLQVQDLDGSWRTILSGEYTGWMEDEVSTGKLTPMTMHYRCFDEVTGTSIGVEVECKPGGITLKADGHGDKCTVPGLGSPVFIEFRDGQLWVRVWADVNQEDPTHSICLGGARLSCEGERPMFVQTSQPTCDGGTYSKFEPFLGKPGDRVEIVYPEDRDRHEGEIVELIPAQAGFNGPLVYVRLDEDGTNVSVPPAFVEVIHGE